MIQVVSVPLVVEHAVEIMQLAPKALSVFPELISYHNELSNVEDLNAAV